MSTVRFCLEPPLLNFIIIHMCECGGIGRRAGLKIPFRFRSVSSILTIRTTVLQSLFYGLFNHKILKLFQNCTNDVLSCYISLSNIVSFSFDEGINLEYFSKVTLGFLCPIIFEIQIISSPFCKLIEQKVCLV